MMQYLSTFRLYSAEVLLLALGVTLVASLLKKTLLKNVQSKVYVFLPFGIGLVFYAIFRMIVTTSFTPLTSELGATLEGGFACGCAATLYYVVWEQFFRSAKATAISPVYPLLAGFVKEDTREEIASLIYEQSLVLKDDELSDFIKSTLQENATEEVTQGELEALCLLLKEFLSALSSQ